MVEVEGVGRGGLLLLLLLLRSLRLVHAVMARNLQAGCPRALHLELSGGQARE